MAVRGHPIFFWIFLLVVAPIGAFVTITALLLFGVRPRAVFAPGFAIKSLLELTGLHPPNGVAVASTFIAFWVAIAGIGLIWEWRRAS